MRRSTLLFIFVSLLTFGIYFFAIEPFLDEKWQRALVFVSLFSLVRFLQEKVENHFEFLKKRIDNHLSVWIVVGILSSVLIVGMFV